MKVILLLFFIFVGAQCTTYDTDIYEIKAKNQSLLLVDSSSGYDANDVSNIYSISVLKPILVEPFEVEYLFKDEGDHELCKGKITTCDCDPSTPSGAAMALLLKSLASDGASCPLAPGDYKVPDESRIENVELGPDAIGVDTIILQLDMQQGFFIETYLTKVE